MTQAECEIPLYLLVVSHSPQGSSGKWPIEIDDENDDLPIKNGDLP